MPKEKDIVRPKARPVALERDGNGGSNKGGSKVDPAITRNDKSFGYHGKDGNYVPWYVDMVNGGGMNASGDTFEGGPYSGVLNALGVRPMGSPASATPYARVASSGSPYGQDFFSSSGFQSAAGYPVDNQVGISAGQYPRRSDVGGILDRHFAANKATDTAGYPLDNQVGISSGLMSQSQPVSQPVMANGASNDVVLEFAPSVPLDETTQAQNALNQKIIQHGGTPQGFSDFLGQIRSEGSTMPFNDVVEMYLQRLAIMNSTTRGWSGQ